MIEFEGTAWTNGSGAFGIKIAVVDRDAHFRREWKTVRLCLPDCFGEAIANVDKESFWNGTCRELIDARIGSWFRAVGIAPWPLGAPPKVWLVPTYPAVFDVGL